MNEHHSEKIFTSTTARIEIDSNTKKTTSINKESREYIEELNRCIVGLSTCRLSGSSPFGFIRRLKSLPRITSNPHPPLFIYIKEVFAEVTESLIETLKYLFINDQSFLIGLQPYRNDLILKACESDNIEFFEFILDIVDSEIDWMFIMCLLMRQNSKHILPYVLTEKREYITSMSKINIDIYKNELISEVCSLNNILLFKWLCEDIILDLDQAYIMNKVCFSLSFELLEWLVTEKQYDVNASIANGTTGLMSSTVVYRKNLTSEEQKSRRNVINFLLANGADILKSRFDGRNVLHLAVELNDGVTLCALDSTLRNQGKSIRDIKDDNGETVVHWAIKSGLDRNLPFLIRLVGEDILDGHGLNLANYACVHGRANMADNLLKSYPSLDLRATTTGSLNVLHHLAGSTKHLESTKWLIEKKGFPLEEVTDAGDTALLVAAIRKNYAFLSYLVWCTKKSVNIQATNNSKNHIGHYLAGSDNTLLAVKLVAEQPINCLAENIEGKTMLEIALLQGISHFILVKACLIKIQNSKKQTRKSAKKLFRRKDLLPLFIEFFEKERIDTDLNELDRYNQLGYWVYDNQTPLHLLAAETSIQTIKEHIVTYNFDINIRNPNGQTVICYMICEGKIQKAKLFLEQLQPQIRDIDNRGSSILHIMVEQSQVELLKWSINNLEIDILSRRRDGLCALDIAIDNENDSCISFLWSRLSFDERLNYFLMADFSKQDFLKQNLSYNPYDINGLTLLQLSTDLGYVEQVKSCIETGIFSVLAKDIQGKSALDVAIDKRYIELTKILFACLSSREALDYFRQASNQDQKYLISNQIYNPIQQSISSAMFKGLFQEVASELALEVARDEILKEEKLLIVRELIHKETQTIVDCFVDNATKSVRKKEIVKREVEDVVDDVVGDIVRNISDDIVIEKNEVLTTPTVQFVSAPKDIISRPRCYHNHFIRVVIDELEHILSREDYQELKALLFGSGVFRDDPSDIDIVFVGINTPRLRELVNLFIKHLCEARGASIVVRDLTRDLQIFRDDLAHDDKKELNSPKSSSLEVVPIEWLHCRIEFSITAQTLEEHYLGLDYGLNAIYYDIVRKYLFEQKGNNGLAVLLNGVKGEIDTIKPPRDSFKDLRVVFRGIRLISSIPELFFSQRCLCEIQRLFSSGFNPFSVQKMPTAHLRQHIATIYSSRYTKVPNIYYLNYFNILPHIVSYLRETKIGQNKDLACSLSRYFMVVAPGSLEAGSEEYVHSPRNKKNKHHRDNFSPKNSHHRQNQQVLFKRAESSSIKPNGSPSKSLSADAPPFHIS
ncbi:MAG: hypothetical protein P1U74_04475 [Legionellaceae bacterium]|nr:hypothetical protein [Legionellaceae bacterium]